MERNVLTWNQALDKGYEPSFYPYDSTDIPAGSYKAVLDFKIWAKKAMAVSCYFSLQDIERKICISVFRERADKLYHLPNSTLDFAECPTSREYEISINYNGKGKMSLKEACLI